MEQPNHRKTLTLGIMALFLGIVFTILFYQQWIGLNYVLFSLITICGILFLASTFSRKIDKATYAAIIVAIFFSLMVFVRSSALLTFFNVIESFFLFLVIINSVAGKKIKSYFPTDYLKIFILPFRFISPLFNTLPEIFSFRRKSSGNPLTKEVVRGVIMSIVAVVVFAWLLSSADAVFHTIFSTLFDFRFDDDLVKQILLTACVALFFIGTFGFAFKKNQENSAEVSPDPLRSFGVTEVTILLSSISALFFVFILLQLAYLFGGVTHLLSAGVTYADYARKGFFELNVVAILSYLIVSFAEKKIIKKDDSHSRTFKALSSVLLVEVVLILVSAFMRLSLYEEAYGFTTIRLYSHAFMIWLGVVLILFAYHLWKNNSRAIFAFHVFGTIMLLLFAMNLLNPDAFIAQKNLERYSATGHIDANYLGGLSDDALPYTIHLLDDPDVNVRSAFADSLYEKINACDADNCENAMSHTWQSLHLDRPAAETLLSAQMNKIISDRMLLIQPPK